MAIKSKFVGKLFTPMKDTIPRNFDINLNINITNIKNIYQQDAMENFVFPDNL